MQLKVSIPILGTPNLAVKIQERYKKTKILYKNKRTNILYKNKRLPPVTLLSKLNIESEHNNAVSKRKNHNITLIFLFLSILR